MKNLKNVMFSIFVFASFLVSVNAASFSISSNVKEVAPNKTFTIKVGGECIGRVNLAVTNGSLSTTSVWVEQGYVDVTVTSGTSGKVIVTATPVTGFSDADANLYQPGAKSVTISISSPASNPNSGSEQKPTPPSTSKPSGEQKPSANSSKPSTGTSSNPAAPVPSKPVQESKSSDNTLASLEIKEGELSPKFDKNVTEYTLSLKENSSTITIHATTSHSEAKVAGIGEKKLKVGENIIELVVTASNGARKTYKIKCVLEDIPEIFLNYQGEKIGILKKETSLESFKIVKHIVNEKEILLYEKENLSFLYGINEAKEKNFYFLNKETNEIICKVIPLNIHNKIYYVTDKEIQKENTKADKIVIHETEVDCSLWELNEDYCFLRVLKEDQTFADYLYEKTESTMQLYPNFTIRKTNDFYPIIAGLFFVLLLIETIFIFMKKGGIYEKKK